MDNLKVRLKNFTTRLNPEEGIQEVRYIYYINDGSGLLEINQTIDINVDPVEEFCYIIKKLYQYNKPIDYYIYHTKMKYILYYIEGLGYQLEKVKCY